MECEVCGIFRVALGGQTMRAEREVLGKGPAQRFKTDPPRSTSILMALATN